MKRYGAIYADPPWNFQTRSERGQGRSADRHYGTMTTADICGLPVRDFALPDSVLFIWGTWPKLPDTLGVISAWGFEYKTCAFDWMKLNRVKPTVFMGMGYWTRSNTEFCLLATRGKPKRLHADVPQAVLEPVREHSRKPACIHDRIERLVAGPYIEMFARTKRPGWDVWGNQTDKFDYREGIFA